MKYSVDLTLLIKLGITANQHLLAYCIVHKEDKELHKYIKACGAFSPEDVKNLCVKGLLLDNNKEDEFLFQNFYPTQTLIETFDIKTFDDFTKDLLKVFPSTTPNGRKLKQVSRKDVETLYLKCHQNKKENHEKIIELLKLEIDHRSANNSLDYMQNIKTWLRNMSYTAYEEDLKNNTSESKQSMHGSKLF